MKKRFDIGRQIVQVQLLSGLNKLNENILRNYFAEFANRFLQYGPKSFPTSFNVLEPFFTFNPVNSVLQLSSEEESYIISLVDFLDFVTNKEFELDKIDFYDNIPEDIIYHFSFDSDYGEINFSNSKGKKFVIKSLSLVRQQNEVSILMQAGETYDKKESDEYFKDKSNQTISDSISPAKKALGLKLESNSEQPKVVNLEDRDDLWLHSVAILIDIETNTFDIRHVARDENISYSIYTDDFHAIFAGQEKLNEEEVSEYFQNQLKLLENYDSVFDFGKYCLALPYYVFENEEKIVDVIYETRLSDVIKGPVSKREYQFVPSKYKQFAKPLFYLESESLPVIKNGELKDDSFKINKSGYWKRLEIDEVGFDKKGREIIGKTWVERTDSYFTNPKGITKVEQTTIFDNEEAGFVYIMRQPAHEENIFKIGLTKRTSEQRSKELSNTSTIDKFFIINKYQTRNCEEAERLIHEKLEKYRLSKRREFFRCELKKILDACESITEKINKNYIDFTNL